MHRLYIVSGIEGSGKSTVGQRIVQEGLVRNAIFVDQDSFYQSATPATTVNSIENLDASFTQKLATMLAQNPVVLVGSSITADILPVQAVVNIHLVLARDPMNLSKRCQNARIAMTPNINRARNLRAVEELIIPFYHEILRKSDISHFVNVFDEKMGVRRSLDSIMIEIRQIISQSEAPRQNIHTMDISQPYFDLIRSGAKTVEGRKISDTWKKVRRGDTLVITSPGQVYYRVVVTGVAMYLPSIGDPLTAYLKGEGLKRALPNAFSIEEGRRIYLQWSTEQQIRDMGMMAIQVRVV